MDSRLLRWLVLGFACLWFGMLVPIHQRGQIQLPGSKAQAAELATQCARTPDGAAHCHKPPHEQTGQPQPAKQDGDKPENCAVCHYILGLHIPPPVMFEVAPLGLLRERVAEEPAVAPVRHAALPFHGLDPPTV
jgi:hypothetical protein